MYLHKENKDILSMIRIVTGDITTIDADAIVNATDSSYSGIGGIDFAIHKAAGKELAQALPADKKLDVGQSVITPAFEIRSAKWIIHTRGPKWKTGFRAEERKLAECYYNSLQLAIEYKCESVAFPCISVGVNHFPEERASEIALYSLYNMLSNIAEDTSCIKQIIFVCSSEKKAIIYKNHLKRMIIDEFLYYNSPESFYHFQDGYFTYMNLLADLEWGHIKHYNTYCDNFIQKLSSDLPDTYTEYDGYALNMDKWDYNTCLAYIIFLQRVAYWSGGLEHPHCEQCENGIVRKALNRMRTLLR